MKEYTYDEYKEALEIVLRYKEQINNEVHLAIKDTCQFKTLIDCLNSKDLSPRNYSVLLNLGFTYASYISELSKLDLIDLVESKNFGKNSLREFISFCKKYKIKITNNHCIKINLNTNHFIDDIILK